MLDLNEVINQKQEQINKLNRDIEELKKDKNKVDFIVIDDWAYETKEHNFNKTYDEILNLIPEGKQLWTKEDCIKLFDDERFNLKDCWFWIERMFKDKSAWFNANSDWAVFDCDRIPTYYIDWLGVRFKWRVK